ncbi:hypothetical protein AGABI1DRAFT_112304 [Agaricus bisporus var. burnettii JB137-S8]|uniref:Uncharacterized protein n=1 Tax=Agaricus bisporus var. burnettii (strain JB137-S8 / ATCC MYA-4627 / FGSC 10392) TaxID=597362 RepID=K5Y2W3_AGABU|nr:uncharacterized protein AGABI1DRAFT_112304 [Agaricus bisporus var. burnettii JB137-S8]EKM82235.1 hypothetical protein AGABI1DRAFT_112304 [Agaricus bisporus var. burnettii JB137-S8]
MSAPTYDPENPPRPSRSLEGRVAIVTGAGSRANGIGNGRAASVLLAEAGAKVVCVDLNISWAEITVNMIAREFGEKAIAVEADVSKEDDCKRIVDTALATYGRLDILINNVGVGGPEGTAVEVDPVKWAKGLEINVTSMVLMSKFAIPAMCKNERDEISGCGAIVNISSVAGMVGGTPMLLYPTSKGAIVNMTRAMAFHHAPQGIRVNCVCPGVLYTPMVYSHPMSTEVREMRRNRSLLKTEGNGWDTGAAVRFLASDEARWITGIILPVDAGATAAIVGQGKQISSTLPSGEEGSN